jgi:hypothetical protein
MGYSGLFYRDNDLPQIFLEKRLSLEVLECNSKPQGRQASKEGGGCQKRGLFFFHGYSYVAQISKQLDGGTSISDGSC